MIGSDGARGWGVPGEGNVCIVGSLTEQTLPLGASSEQSKDFYLCGTDILACRRETINVYCVGESKDGEEEEISKQVKAAWVDAGGS